MSGAGRAAPSPIEVTAGSSTDVRSEQSLKAPESRVHAQGEERESEGVTRKDITAGFEEA